MKIKIGYMEYLIVFTDKDPDNYGTCEKPPAVIYISTELPLRQQAATLMHEIFHAVWDMWQMPEKAVEEVAVSGLSNGYSTVLHDNPELSEWVQNALESPMEEIQKDEECQE